MTTLLFQSNNPLFSSFSLPHMLLLLSPVFGIILMLKNQSLVRSPKFSKAIWIFLMTLLFGQQILLYSWYFFTGNFDIKDALPLYPCRVSSLLCIACMIKWDKRWFDLLFFMGLPGAILALLMPDTWNLGFPNAMFIQFFAGHSAILLTIFYLVISKGYNPTKEALFSAYKICSIYLAGLIVLNQLLGSNYGYMAQKPDIPALSWLPGFPWHLPLFIGLMYFLYWLLYMIWPKNKDYSLSVTTETSLEMSS